MKFIRTKLLIENKHNSAIGIATASHIDFCRWQFRGLRTQQWSYNEYMNMTVMFIASSFALLSIPLFVLTHGLILYPFWIVNHIIQVRKIRKKFGVEFINSGAEELVKEFSEMQKNEKTRTNRQ